MGTMDSICSVVMWGRGIFGTVAHDLMWASHRTPQCLSCHILPAWLQGL